MHIIDRTISKTIRVYLASWNRYFSVLGGKKN